MSRNTDDGVGPGNRTFLRLKRLAEMAWKGGSREPRVPDGSRVYAVGDIHGRSDLLEEIHRRIMNDAANALDEVEKTVVYLGDYIDRSLNSKEVVELLLEAPLQGFNSVFLKGNHEDSLLRFLEDPTGGPDWFSIGGGATVLSYGIKIPKGLTSSQRFEYLSTELPDRIPPRHLEFLSSLQLMHVAGDYAFVHAGVRPGVPLDRQRSEDLMWIRREFLDSMENPGKVIVHGHSSTARPDIQKYRIGIDTGAYTTNVLTCLALEGANRWFITANGDR